MVRGGYNQGNGHGHGHQGGHPGQHNGDDHQGSLIFVVVVCISSGNINFLIGASKENVEAEEKWKSIKIKVKQILKTTHKKSDVKQSLAVSF